MVLVARKLYLKQKHEEDWCACAARERPIMRAAVGSLGTSIKSEKGEEHEAHPLFLAAV